MTALDPDDSRPPFRKLADVLRASILTGKLGPGAKLPSGPELVERYGVAKATAQKAVEALKEEGLVVSRQGSGVFVRERAQRPVELRPHIERAFTDQTVTIDFAGFSGETLHGALSEPLDKIRDGRFRPESVSVRILIPDPSNPWSLPARIDDMADVPAFRKRAARIMDRHTFAISDEINELERMGLISSTSVEVRAYPAAPMFKLYIINKSEMFFGYYAIQEHEIVLDGQPTRMWDLMGKDTALFYTTAGDTSPRETDGQFVQQSQAWFDSVWRISRELEN
ncbi:GntR family transcriptional regulator [Nocardia sp. CA-135398]|uniref:GntR family transcriptional regulator n=1 Tax=Nocardia sp. CA-135398 TaxID=3239977 RepID=UPI003D99E697